MSGWGVGITQRGPARLAWFSFALILGLVAAAEVVAVVAGPGAEGFVAAMLTFPLVGALVASRHPSNKVGWLMLGIGAVWALAAGFGAYAHYGLEHPGTLPRPDVALALQGGAWVPGIGLIGTFLILIFPDGRLPSPRWRAWAWFTGAVLALCYLAITTFPASFEDFGYPEVQNPLGIAALGDSEVLVYALIALVPVCIFGCAIGLVQRYRRSRGQERLQLRWLTTAAALMAVAYLMMMTLSLPYAFADEDAPAWIESLSQYVVLVFFLLPIAIGIAILKYRLYEIDVIIKRTLVYGLLTGMLTAMYLLFVTLLQSMLRPFAAESELAVAGSTLAVATIFQPLRTRIQAFIDRRFYRRRYDANRTVAGFSTRLRDEVDLDTLNRDLVALVREVMQPTHVSLWLLGTEGREPPAR